MTVLTYASPDVLAEAVASRLLLKLQHLQARGVRPQIVLTGGSIADKVHTAMSRSTLRDIVDWTDVDFWWGDERFVAADDGDRNEGQARAALLDAVGVSTEQLHPMPADDGSQDVEQASLEHAEELKRCRRALGPRFDVVMLGVGPDGHVASLFPGQSTLDVADRLTVGITDSPKPPPQRISMTFPVLNDTAEVWFVAAGADKAPAVRSALGGADRSTTPAAGVAGHPRADWMVDAEIARELA